MNNRIEILHSNWLGLKSGADQGVLAQGAEAIKAGF